MPTRSKSAAAAKPKRPPKTPKEKAFVKEYLTNGGNGAAAAEKVYDVTSYKSATVIASENLAKLSFSDYFAKAGLTDEKITEVVTEAATKATKIHGTDNDFIEIPDHNVRLKAVDLAVKIQGKMPKDDVNLGMVFIDTTKEKKETYEI